MLTYEQSGVNIDEGNRAVSLIKNKIKIVLLYVVIKYIGYYCLA